MEKYQNYELKNIEIKDKFDGLKKKNSDFFKKKLNFSWSNWNFGVESLIDSVKRLKKFGIDFIELKANKHGDNIGYNAKEVIKILSDNDIKVSGLCWIYSNDNILSSNRLFVRQKAIEYIKRNIEFGAQVGAKYFLVVAGEVGTNTVKDPTEFYRAVESLQIVAEDFINTGVKCAIEPISSIYTSFCHTFEDVKKIFKEVNVNNLGYINGDVYHMFLGEKHIGQSIVEAGQLLTNLHLSDTIRGPLGSGILDVDTIIRALYLIGYNNDSCFVTSETVPQVIDLYAATNAKVESSLLDDVVRDTIKYFREREDAVLTMA
jgi:D-psicose/D-tagatose/L-ribulose 3-epimerase